MEDDKTPCPRVYGQRSKARESRTCVKNLRAGAYQEHVKSDSVSNRTPKRKARLFDDDPIYSEVDDEDEGFEDESNDQHKKIPGYRCSPHWIPDLIENLTDKQRGWVKKIEWDSFLDMIESRMPKSLTMWLVDRVDTTSGCLDVGGFPVNIREAVVRILKLPSGGLKVPAPLNGRSKAKRPKGDTSCFDQKYSANGRGNAAKNERTKLLAIQEDEEEFCCSFVMLILCIHAAPTTSLNINRNYLPSLMDVSKIRLMDWSGFIADYLVQGIREYRESKAFHIQVPGCVHLLPLMYVDTLIRLKVLELPESLKLPEDEPRIHFIGTQHLYMVASLDVKSISKDKIEYGALLSARGIGRQSEMKLANNEDARNGKNVCTPRSKSAASCQPRKSDKECTPRWFHNLFQEIEESREHLLDDLKQRIKLSDQQIFNKYKQQYCITADVEGIAMTEEVDPMLQQTFHRDEAVKNVPAAVAKGSAVHVGVDG